jgi:hypothetical protein
MNLQYHLTLAHPMGVRIKLILYVISYRVEIILRAKLLIESVITSIKIMPRKVEIIIVSHQAIRIFLYRRKNQIPKLNKQFCQHCLMLHKFSTF